MKKVSVIGMGMSPADLTEAHLRLIRQADVLIGGKRQLAYFADIEAEKIEIAGNLAQLPGLIEARMEDAAVVVLASGDPLFYGIGSYLSRRLPKEWLAFYPNISTVAAASARIGEPWQDTRVVTCHGRGALSALLQALSGKRPVAVYTDPDHHPAWIARQLAERAIDRWRMCVAEQLGTERETVRWYSLSDAAGVRFSEPNLVILFPEEDADAPPTRPFGISDPQFAHDKGMITKAEVRAVVLSKLRLTPGCVLWDLGAGSGAVGIEAAALIVAGEIFSVEKNAGRVEAICENRSRFAVENMHVVQADLPDGIEDLPTPDRIFIGGGGPKLAAIIAAAAERLRPGGILVVNTVLMANVETARAAMRNLGWGGETVQVQVCKCREMPYSERLEAQNPVWIISGVKPETRRDGHD